MVVARTSIMWVIPLFAFPELHVGFGARIRRRARRQRVDALSWSAMGDGHDRREAKLTSVVNQTSSSGPNLLCNNICAKCIDGAVVRVYRDMTDIDVAKNLAFKGAVVVASHVAGAGGGLLAEMGGEWVAEQLASHALEVAADVSTEAMGDSVFGQYVDASMQEKAGKVSDVVRVMGQKLASKGAQVTTTKAEGSFYLSQFGRSGPDVCKTITFSTQPSSQALQDRKLGTTFDLERQETKSSRKSVYAHVLDYPGKGDRENKSVTNLDIFRKKIQRLSQVEREDAGLGFFQGLAMSATDGFENLGVHGIPVVMRLAIAADPILCGLHGGLEQAVALGSMDEMVQQVRQGMNVTYIRRKNYERDESTGFNIGIMEREHVQCGAVVDENLKLFRTMFSGVHMQPTIPAGCANYMLDIGCSWTREYTCPGQVVEDSLWPAEPKAINDIGYICCCMMKLWKLRPMFLAEDDGR